jgi:hypothetical protein
MNAAGIETATGTVHGTVALGFEDVRLDAREGCLR